MSDRRLLVGAEGTHQGELRPADWVALGTVALTWGASFLFIAIGLDAFHPAVIGFGRIALGALTLAFVPSARRPAEPIRRADLARLGLLAVTWMAVPLLLFPFAERSISSALAGMLNGGMPIMTAVVAVLLGLRRPKGVQITGLAVGFVGVVLISLPALSIGGDDALGVGLIMIALVCYAVSANLAVPLQQRYGGPALMLRVEALGAVLTAPFAIAGLGESTFRWSSMLAVLALGVAGTGAAFAVMAAVLGRVGATRGSMVTYLMPPVSIALGVAVRGDHLDAVSVVGSAIVLVGAWLLGRGG